MVWRWRTALGGDLAGGVTAATLTIPVSMGFGALAVHGEADEDLVCYVLSEDAFTTLVREHHDVAIKLLASLARELSARLRRATQTIYELEA